MPQRKRRYFTPEQKADAVQMVRRVGNLSKVARELDLMQTALRSWVQQADIDAGTLAGESRDCLVYYCDPLVLGGCAATSTFNSTQTGSVSWWP